MNEISNEWVPASDYVPMYCNHVTGITPARDAILTRNGFDSIASGFGMSTPCKQANPDSVRFFHKFDPIPSIGMWHGHFAHSVEHAVMVWDEYSTDCDNDVVYCEITADPEYSSFFEANLPRGRSANTGLIVASIYVPTKRNQTYFCSASEYMPMNSSTG